ncbi:MAG: NAD(P)H-dependent oxidoreductase [Emcibacteraceae bacterium]
MTKLLFLAGSARKGSINKKLADAAAELATQKGAVVTKIDLKDFEMPIYDGDLEEKYNLPENAVRLKKLFIEHDGFFIASPEYNSSIPPLLKNALDWISRPHEADEKPLSAYQGKIAAIGSTSPGALGGLRGLVPLRMMLSNIAVHVIPNQVAISFGFDAFDETGKLKNEGQEQMLSASMEQFVQTASAL